MRNEVAVRNGRDIKNTQNESYTVDEIAEKIVEDHNYLVQLSEGVSQVVKYNSEYLFFHIDYSRKVKVYKGQKLGAYKDGDYDKIDVKATNDGFFEPDLSHFEWKNIGKAYFSDKCDLVIGKIFFPEYDFFRDNERKIDNAVKKLKESKQLALEIEEQSKRDEEQRKNEKLLTDQRKSIENLDNLLKELDKYIEKKELPEIQTLKDPAVPALYDFRQPHFAARQPFRLPARALHHHLRRFQGLRPQLFPFHEPGTEEPGHPHDGHESRLGQDRVLHPRLPDQRRQRDPLL